MNKLCLICTKPFKKNKYYCSQECATESLKGVKNEKGRNWKGNAVTRTSIHEWLRVNFGKPNKCEMENCKGKSAKYDWSKKHGYDYVKERDAFWMLCKGCHARYDIQGGLKHPPIPTKEHVQKMLKNRWDKFFREHPENIRHVRKSKAQNQP